MKKFLLILSCVVGTVTLVCSQSISLPPSGDNQKCIVTQYVGSLVKVTVTYNSPDVTGPDGMDRTGKIWGTDVAHYGMVKQGFGLDNPSPWRAGANECTTIHFSHDVLIEGKPLAAGKYGLFLMVAQSGPWTWIFSKNTSGWGSYYYDEKEDALRVEVQPKDHPHTEWLTYIFTDRDPDATTLELQWELKSIPMRISVPNVHDIYITQLDKEFQGQASFTASNFTNAANYLLNEEYNLPKALEWVDRGMAPGFFGRVDFASLTTRAQILMKMGKGDDAMATIEKAMHAGDANPSQIHQLGRSLVGIGKKEEALTVFKANYEMHKGKWPTNVGMVRGLSAVGKYAEAIPYAEAALAEAPDELNKNNLVKMIEKLKANQDVN
jgi:tetratricopeptide (TPR) repeat protein